MVYVLSSHDNRPYLVNDLSDKKEAADILSRVRSLLEKVIVTLNEEYPNDTRVTRIMRRINLDNIHELPKGDTRNDQSGHGTTSYTVDKGYKIVFCLRENGARFVEWNTLVFVALHELAHVMSISLNHDNQEFWDNFKFILEHAIDRGYYQYHPYHEQPKVYCNMQINHTPVSSP